MEGVEVTPDATPTTPGASPDAGIAFAEGILHQMDTPKWRLEYGGDSLSLDEVVRNTALNPANVQLDEVQAAALRVVLEAQNEIVSEAWLLKNRVQWRAVVNRIQSGDYLTPDVGDKDALERVRSAAERPFADRPGLNVLVQGIPCAQGSGANRLLVWARDDRYGVVEAWDAAQAARATRERALRDFFTALADRK